VTIRLFKFATIGGLVVDDQGEPVVGVTVRAYRRSLVAGRRVLSQVAQTAATDDRGMYRLSALVPGEFVISVPFVQASQPASFSPQGQMPPDLLATIVSPGSGGFSISYGGAMVTSDPRFLLQPQPSPTRPRFPTGAATCSRIRRCTTRRSRRSRRRRP
jgi:hypothetical protein